MKNWKEESKRIKYEFEKVPTKWYNFYCLWVITLKQDKIKNVSETFDDVIAQLKFLDDEKSIKDNGNALNFYFDKEKSLLYTSSFFNKYDFYISYQYKEKQSVIDSEYFTPILFEFSLKG